MAIQLVLMAFVFFGPRTFSKLPSWPAAVGRITDIAGFALLLGGASLLVAGAARLRSNLTPLPHPRPRATLIQSGPYRLVRHPMYAGGILIALGWALLVRGWLTLAGAAVLFMLFDLKSTREERWLVERFPEYRDYQRRVGKLIPFIR